MASKEELLNSILPGMRLTKDFFKQIYGYEISYPGFKDIALQKLKDAGCTRAAEYYDQFVSKYERQQKAIMKEVARWYVTSSKNERSAKHDTYVSREGGEKNWKEERKKLLERKKELLEKSRLLTKSLQN